MKKRRKRRRRKQQAEEQLRGNNRMSFGLPGGQYKPLSAEGVRQIHEAALRVLAQTGVAVEASECRRILAAGGAVVDSGEDRVYFPREIVENALRLVNKAVVLYSRDGRFDLHLRGKQVHLGTGGAAIHVLDLHNGQVRDSTLRDLFEIGRLVEELDNIHFYLRPVVARDIPGDVLDENTFYACLAGTRKHIMGGCYFAKNVAKIKRMAALIAGGEEAFTARPFLSLNLGYMVSPLRFAMETMETVTAAVRAGLPVSLVSAPQAGATSPASLVGTLVQTIAEELAGITYVMMLKPGHPLLMGGMPLVSDLRTGGMIGGSAELALMNAAMAQMSHFYEMPIYNSCGLTDSKIPDAQAGFEKGLTAATAALAGSQYIHHAAGMLESMLTVAYEQYVIDDDINGQVMRLVRGLDINEEALSLDTIDTACRGEGHYLGQPQTLSLMNNEFHYPHTADRRTRDDWAADGELDMRERARQKAISVLEQPAQNHIPVEADMLIRDEMEILLSPN